MPITFAKTGEQVQIKRIVGKDDTKRFLESLGFVPGGMVSVVTEHGGNLILSIKESRVAIDKSMANRIIV